MLRVEMLPAAEGDALWIEYGHVDAPRRILVDGGPARTYDALRARILQLPRDKRHFELVVATHIDADHIDGIILLLRDTTLGVTIGDLWFNGYPQLIEEDTQGAPEGEILSALIQQLDVPWNKAFEGRAAMARSGFPTVSFAGGMGVRVIAPARSELDILLDKWNKVLAEEHWIPGDPDRPFAELDERRRLRAPSPIPEVPPADELGDELDIDPSEANRASIVMLVEAADGERCLLTGDAHGDVLARQLALVQDGALVKVDALKLPHHGSRNNVSAEMLAAVKTRRYLISSSGAKYGHPDAVTIDRILERHEGQPGKPELSFNYRTVFNNQWADEELQKQRRYQAMYPEGITVEL